MSSHRQPSQPIVGSHDHRTVQCVKCSNKIPIPTRCNKCGTDISPLLRGDASKTGSTSKDKVPCERCGKEFKRSADKKRHQRFSCLVKADATEEELFYCPLRSTESCAERGYRPDKLLDHLRQTHGIDKIDRSGGGARLSYQGQDRTPPEGRFEEMSISEDSGSWYSGRNPSLSEQAELDITRVPQQYAQHQHHNAPYGGGYSYDESLYEDNATASRYPLPSYPPALDSGAGGIGRHHQPRNSTGASYLDPRNTSGLPSSGNVGHAGQSSYPIIPSQTALHGRQQHHSRQQYQGQASLETGSYTYAAAEMSPWDGNSNDQTTYTHSTLPDSGQYPGRNDSSQRRQGRHRGDWRQGGQG